MCNLYITVQNTVVAIAVGVSVTVFVLFVCIPICVVVIIVCVVVGVGSGGRRRKVVRNQTAGAPTVTQHQLQPTSEYQPAPVPGYQPPAPGYQPPSTEAVYPPKPYKPPHLHANEVTSDTAPIIQN